LYDFAQTEISDSHKVQAMIDLAYLIYEKYPDSAFLLLENAEKKLANYLNINENSVIMDKLKWLGIFEREPIGLDKGTPAQILQKLLKF